LNVTLHKKIKFLLTRQEKKKSIYMLVLTFINSLLDVISLAILLPLINLFIDNDLSQKNYFLKFIYDLFHFTSTTDFTLFIFISTLLIFIGKTAISIYINYIITKFAYDVAYRITETNFNFNIIGTICSVDVAYRITETNFNIFYNLSLNDYNATNSVVFFREIRNTPVNFANLILLTYFQLITEIVVLVLLLIGLIVVEVRVLLMFVLVIVPILALLYKGTKKRIEKIGHEVYDLDIGTARLMNESILGFIDIILLNKRSFFIRSFLNLTKSTNTRNILKTMYGILLGKILEVISILGIFIIFVFNSYVAHSSPAQLITLLTVFGIASYRMLPSINRILNSLLTLKKNEDTLNGLVSFTNIKNDDEKDYSKMDSSESRIVFNEFIEFNDVSFSYPGKRTFKMEGLSLTIKKGEKIGIIGKSGSGKTTLIHLLLRFLKESKGNIIVDGVKLDDSNRVSWRQKIGYVPQNFSVLDSSIKENIAFGESQIDLERLDKAIKLAQLSEFIDSCELGVDTKVGENAARISGGQRQRIGIARALYRNSELLILDEATNSLDIETEREITETVKSLKNSDITIIIIAHRLTTLEHCSRIIEIKEGTIAGTYTYSQIVSEKLNLTDLK